MANLAMALSSIGKLLFRFLFSVFCFIRDSHIYSSLSRDHYSNHNSHAHSHSQSYNPCPTGVLLCFFSAALQGGLQARQGMLERLPHSLRFGPVRLQGRERCLQVLYILQKFLFLVRQGLELCCELARLLLRRCCLLRQRFVQGL